MNALQVNQKTHFLESVNPLKQTFTSDKKLKLLQLANEHISTKQEVPDVLSLCNALGVNVRTFQRHLATDSTFNECWKEVLAKIDLLLTNDLYVKSKSKMGTLALLAYLRHNESGKWNQEQTINHVTDSSSSKTLLSSVNDFIEADIVGESKQLNTSKSAKHSNNET